MNQDASKSRRPAPGATPVAPGGKAVRPLTIIVVVLALAGVWVVGKKLRPTDAPVEITAVPTRNDSGTDAAEVSPPTPVPPGDPSGQVAVVAADQNSPAPDAGSAAAKRAPEPASATPEAPRPEPTPFTRQLVTGLTQLDIRGGVVSPEQAAQWKQGLQQLIQQGAAGVPAIREFLEKNLDLRFTGVPGDTLGGYPSLRAGLFDALAQIGGPEALEAGRQVLRTTADPLEIALLARSLEQQAPGAYRSEALDAAYQALRQAAQDPTNARDVAPLYQLLQTYGDASYVASLRDTLPRWTYYSTLALAGLPEGQGVPFLIQQAQDPKSAGTTSSSFAVQLLAQMAGQHPEAANALMEQARLNRISDSTWQQLGAVLKGDEFRFGSRYVDGNLPPSQGSGVHSYHISYGSQNFYTAPVGMNASPQQIAQRRAMIDQLLNVTLNPTGIAVLRAARQALPGGG